MIESVSLRDLGVIVVADVELGPGLTVITGETGAGKTMLLTGLGLLWGGRADATRVRQGCDKAQVEAVISVTDAQVRENLEPIVGEAGASWDGDCLVLARSVGVEGRSRAHLGGRTVPASVLADVAEHLVAVHGQDDQFRLLKPAQQRGALDRYAGPEMARAMAEYLDAYRGLRDAVRERERVSTESAQRRREAEQWREAIAMVDALAPTPGEAEQLKWESGRLSHADELRDGLQRSRALMRGGEGEGSDGALDQLGGVLAELDRLVTRDPRLEDLRQRVTQLHDQLAEVSVDVARLMDSLDADPDRLSVIEARRAELAALARRWALLPPVSEVPHGGAGVGIETPRDPAVEIEAARQRLAELEDDEGLLARLALQIDELRVRAGSAATRVSHLRRAAAAELGGRVTEELAALAMPRARFGVQVRPRPVGEGLVLTVDGVPASADRYGVDDVEFGLAARDDEEPRPLGRGASGGERSRIMLALEVVLASADPVPTMVFDEVDAGVGGRAAVEVGRRLARLGRHVQVLVVTHLAQVAAFADHHIVVRAADDGRVTQASVEQVRGDERRRELARMLAGLEESSSALDHAAELLDLAEQERVSSTGEASPTADTPARGRGPRSASAR